MNELKTTCYSNLYITVSRVGRSFYLVIARIDLGNFWVVHEAFVVHSHLLLAKRIFAIINCKRPLFDPLPQYSLQL